MAKQRRTRTKKSSKPSTYQFNLKDKVVYIGILYDFLKNRQGIVINRSKSDVDEWYTVRFNEEEYELLGRVLKLISD